MIIVKMQDDEKMVEMIPPFTPDFEANVKQERIEYWIRIWTMHLLRGAENLCQVKMNREVCSGARDRVED